MKTIPLLPRLTVALCLGGFLPWFILPAAAQRAGKPLAGERHIYKTVGKVELPLYVYTPDGHQASDKTPAIVFFFGGGWKSGSPSQFEPHCQHLASKGMVGITVEYRVSSRHKVKIEDCIADARSAMRWVRGNARKLGIDPDKIASGGGSAGGHLGATVALIDKFDAKTDDKKVSAVPNAMVLFNPAMAIAPDERLPQKYREAMEERGIKNRSHGDIKDCSPLTFADRKQPPCIMFFGTADRLLIGAETFAKASTKAGNECRIVTYEGQGHGFFNKGRGGKYYDLTVAEMDKFLAKHGFLKKRAAKAE